VTDIDCERMTNEPSILVLAGRRSSTLDPLAAKMDVTHKALVPVAGEAMVGRVLRIAAEAFPARRCSYRSRTMPSSPRNRRWRGSTPRGG
jgi:hypothetical protein